MAYLKAVSYRSPAGTEERCMTSLSRKRDSNPEYPEYEPGVLTTQQTHQVCGGLKLMYNHESETQKERICLHIKFKLREYVYI